MLWNDIMQKCPEMKGLVESKITEEVEKKQSEIDALKERLDASENAILALMDAGLGGGV